MIEPTAHAIRPGITTESLPQFAVKIHVEGSLPGVRVPMREIAQSRRRQTHVRAAENESAGRRLRHLGPVHRSGGGDRHPRGPAAAARARGSTARGDVEELPERHLRVRPARAPPIRSSPALRFRTCSARRAAPRPGAQRHADALRAQRHRHAGDGVHRDPREPAARRGAARRCAELRRAQHPGQTLRRGDPDGRSRPSSCATRSRAAARSSRPTSTTRRPSR